MRGSGAYTADDACALRRYVCDVARRYKFGDVSHDTKQCLSLVRRRFRTEVSLTGREAREFAALVAQDCIHSLPFHLYVSDVGLPLGVW